jgi:YkoY family integral membrane protein
VFFDLHTTDFVTIGLLVVLEGLLSADNALVMAIMVLGLPRTMHQKALRYGLVGGFAFRVAATLLAAYLIEVAWVKLLGGLYLGYLTFSHFRHGDAETRRDPPKARAGFGLSAFWATVVRVELVNLAFSIDSILVAVAMSPKLSVVLTGGILGIIAMRLVVGKLLDLIRRYPALVDGAFVIIGWVALKLVIEYSHAMHWIRWEVPRSLSLGLIVAIFVVAYLYARRQPPVGDPDDAPPHDGPDSIT